MSADMNDRIRDAYRGPRATEPPPPEPPPRDPTFGGRLSWHAPRRVTDPNARLRAMFDARPRANPYRIGGR